MRATHTISLLRKNLQIIADDNILYPGAMSRHQDYSLSPYPMSKQSKRLAEAFYQQDDVVSIAQELLGKYLITNFNGQKTVGRIVETEAYRGPEDKAAHSYNNRYTDRTKVMFEAGGVAYVYLIYGIHHLFNVITGAAGSPHGVLIRGLEPIENIDLMLARRNFTTLKPQLTAGPGVLSKAMGINKIHTGLSLIAPDSSIWIEDRASLILPEQIIASPRVGVAYAEEHARLPWRFRIANNKWTSPRKINDLPPPFTYTILKITCTFIT